MDVLRRLGFDLGLGLLGPSRGLSQPNFQLADARKILVELFAVADSDVRLQPLRLIANRVEHALTIFQSPSLSLDLVRPPLQKQFGEHARRPTLRRHRRSAVSPRQTKPLARQRQGGESRLAVQVFGRELIQRNAVAKSGPLLRMRCGGQKAVVGIVAGADVRVRQPGDHREVVAKILEDFQVRRQLIVPPRLLRKEVLWMHSERRVDADHASLDRRRGGSSAPRHDIQQRQRHRDTRAAKEGSAIKLHGKFLFDSPTRDYLF